MQKRYTRFLGMAGLLSVGIWMAWPLAALAADVADGRPTTFMDYYKQGGFAMWPLLALAVWGTAVFIEIMVRMRKKVFCPESVIQQVREALSVGDYQKAWKVASDNPSPLGKVLAAAIAKLPKGRTAVEETAVEAASAVNGDFKIKLSYLSLIAGIGPMIGLFGTMSGMIGAFNAMAFGGATGDPAKLAGDIGEALITTYSGLVVAIPSMTAYFILLSFLKRIMTKLQDDFIEILETVDFDALPEDLVIVTRGGQTAGAVPAAGAGAGEMVPCPNCKKEIKVGVKVCPHCKTEMDWE